MDSKIKDLGILTMHRVINYGSALQTFATQRIINKLGYSCEIIDYMYPNVFQYQRGTPYTPITLKSKVSKFLGLNSYWRKVNKFEKFYRKYLHLSPNYKSPEELIDNPPRYRAYITGSDQVWNPKHTKGDLTFLLNFVNDAPRISYASSFACSQIDEKMGQQYSLLLSKYSFLSVREKNGQDLIKSLIGRKVTVVLDPTLLLTAKEWLAALEIKDNHRVKRKNYILVYILKYAIDPSPVIYRLINELQLCTGADVIYIGDCGCEKNNWSNTIPSPKKFVELFANAAYVVTSSFHGTAFAVNFGKKVFSVIDEKSSDDRIKTLLETLNLQSSIIPLDADISDLDLNQNSISAQELLKEQRILSMDFLKSSIYNVLIKK